MKKPCIKCGVPRELTEFYRHPGMADGRLNKCKECHRLDVKRTGRGILNITGHMIETGATGKLMSMSETTGHGTLRNTKPTVL
jgi:hypothetical protein